MPVLVKEQTDSQQGVVPNRAGIKSKYPGPLLPSHRLRIQWKTFADCFKKCDKTRIENFIKIMNHHPSIRTLNILKHIYGGPPDTDPT